MDLYTFYKSGFGAKAYGPLADQEAFAPETTTDMSMKPCETRRKCEYLLEITGAAQAAE